MEMARAIESASAPGKIGFRPVDEYIASQPEDIRGLLEQVPSAIRYKIPTYKLPGGPVLYFAGWKRHISLYPACATVVSAFQTDLAPYVVHKGTIRFPLAQPIPMKQIGSIAKFRAKEVAARER